MDLINRNIVEIWGGAEYTVARVNNNVYDQLAIAGLETRVDDLNLFSVLNIYTIRYPLLWEKYADDQKKFFELNDRRLNKLQELNIKPIAGLLHHGSGPFFTDLFDHDFPYLLSDFASVIAERYPWIELYTPVNEPLTTARFSGLYGIWYPHYRDDYSFARILLNELKGIVLSMKAVRNINPSAGLVQTEDLCKIHSTHKLIDQADFENIRRWLTYDILLGRLDSDHPLWPYFIEHGIEAVELEFFMENSMPPDVCGFNYYVTSERYLDHRKSIYPQFYHGGNGNQEYADLEAVRADPPINISVGELLREAWEKYRLPLALTEVHLACTREEQLRWFYEAFQTATSLKDEGIDFRAITAWSFFGSYDWNSLMVRKNLDYESGVFDIRAGYPRPTALARLIKSLSEKKSDLHNLVKIPGWWRRKDRMIYKTTDEDIYSENVPKFSFKNIQDVSPLLITGANGSLGSAFIRMCEARGIVYFATERNQLDIASEESLLNTLATIRPWGIVNTAGFTRIDEAERSSLTCFRENTIGPSIMASLCKQLGIKYVTFSSDQVFDGKKRSPYTESDRKEPLNVYGLSKKLAEEKVLKINPGSLIIRSSAFFNPWYPEDNLVKILLTGSSDQHHYLDSEIIISPSYVPDFVNTVLDLMIDNESGIWHLSSEEEISFFDLAGLALNMAGRDENIITPVSSEKIKYVAERPKYSVLKSSSGIVLPKLSNSLGSFIYEYNKEPLYQSVNQLLY